MCNWVQTKPEAYDLVMRDNLKQKYVFLACDVFNGQTQSTAVQPSYTKGGKNSKHFFPKTKNKTSDSRNQTAAFENYDLTCNHTHKSYKSTTSFTNLSFGTYLWFLPHDFLWISRSFYTTSRCHCCQIMAVQFFYTAFLFFQTDLWPLKK